MLTAEQATGETISNLETPALVSLESAIEQLINLGEKDPLSIARRLEALHGPEWIAEQLANHWQEILAEIARQRLGNERRGSIGSVLRERKGGRLRKREVVLASVFIPGKGYMALGDCTVEDLTSREAYMRRLADGLNRWADYWASLREMVVTQGVERVRDVRGSLPDLPAQALSA